MNLNYNSNRKFFFPKSLLMYIGGGIALLGIPAFAITGGIYFALPFIGIGALCIAINRELNTKESDLKESIKRVTGTLEADLENQYYDPKRPFPRMLQTVIGDYVYGEENILIRPQKIGKPISSMYHAASFGFKNNYLHILERKFSLIDERFTENFYRFAFTDLDRIDYAEEENAGVKQSFLSLYGTDSALICKIPAPTDYTMQKFVDDTNMIFRRHREELAAKEN